MEHEANNMATQREEKEKRRASREMLGKYFYDLSKASFTAMVLGAMLSFFATGTAPNEALGLLLVGSVLTATLGGIAYYILKK